MSSDVFHVHVSGMQVPAQYASHVNDPGPVVVQSERPGRAGGAGDGTKSRESVDGDAAVTASLLSQLLS